VSTVVERATGLALLRIIVGFAIIWVVLDRLALALQSFRGEWGLLVAAATIVAAVVVELVLRSRSIATVLRDLGLLRVPELRIATAVVFLSVALLAFLPIYSLVTGTPIGLIDNWPLLAIGIFAQAGIAEETLFRGYLFRNIREGRKFWPAAWLSAVPFVAVHLLIFITSDPAIAAASVLLALSMSFPLAWAFDLSRGSVWPIALLHAVAQAGLKLIEVPPDRFMPLVLSWIALAAVAPWLLFLLKPKQNQNDIKNNAN
jgi:membrane protease YdiL (CAAX protease family)